MEGGSSYYNTERTSGAYATRDGEKEPSLDGDSQRGGFSDEEWENKRKSLEEIKRKQIITGRLKITDVTDEAVYKSLLMDKRYRQLVPMENNTGVASTTETERKSENQEQMKESEGQKVFDGIYDALKETARTERNGLESFMSGLKNGAQNHHLNDLDGLSINEDIFPEIEKKLKKQLAEIKGDNNYTQKTYEAKNQYIKMRNYVEKLRNTGRANSKTAKAFLLNLPTMKYIGGVYYNTVVKDRDVDIDIMSENSHAYVDLISDIENSLDREKNKIDGAFIHFNHKSQYGDFVKSRLYINADKNKDPEEVLSLWLETLEKLGAREKIYFKIPAMLQARLESIIIYQTDQTDEKLLKNIMDEFIKSCPEELLSKNSVMGNNIYKGMSVAPEPVSINNFLKNIGKEDVLSYNELLTSLAKLSMELAYNDLENNNEENITPKKIKSASGDYFRQMLELATINPETMMSYSQNNGKIPQWAEEIKNKSKV